MCFPTWRVAVCRLKCSSILYIELAFRHVLVMQVVPGCRARLTVAALALSTAKWPSSRSPSSTAASSKLVKRQVVRRHHRHLLQQQLQPLCSCHGSSRNPSTRHFFKSLKPDPSPSLADPFSHLQTNSKQLNKVFHSENLLYHRFFEDNPKLLKLAGLLRQQILEGQDKVRLHFF